MKKYLLTVLLLVFSIVSVGKVSAQCPTPPDCLSDPFIPGTPYVKVLSPTCTLTVNWCWRIACGSYNDLVITSMRLDGDCTAFLSSLAWYQKDAIDQIFLQNPWGAVIPPCPSQSASFWRLGKLGCVSFFLVGMDIMTVVPCEPVSRCWERVKVCYQISPTTGLPYAVTTTNYGTPFPSIPCSETNPPVNPPGGGVLQDGGCQNICEE